MFGGVSVVVDVIGTHVHSDLLGRNIFKEGFGEVFPVVRSGTADACDNRVFTCISRVEVGPEITFVEERVADKQRGVTVVTLLPIFGEFACNSSIEVAGDVIAIVAFIYSVNGDVEIVGKMFAFSANLIFTGFKCGYGHFFGVDRKRGFVVFESKGFFSFGNRERDVEFGRRIIDPGVKVGNGDFAVFDKRRYGKSGCVMRSFSRYDDGFAADENVDFAVYDFDVVTFERIRDFFGIVGFGEHYFDVDAFCPLFDAFDVGNRKRAVIGERGYGEGRLVMSGFCRYGNRFTAFERFYFAFFNLDCAAFERINDFLCFIGFGENGVYCFLFADR